MGFVYFLWVTANFLSHGSKGPQRYNTLLLGCVSSKSLLWSPSHGSKDPPLTLLLHISPFSTMPLHNKLQWLPGEEVNMVVVLNSGRSKIQSSRGNFQSCKRGTSVPCVKLEATHLTNRVVANMFTRWALRDASLRGLGQLRSSLLALPTSKGKLWKWYLFINHARFVNIFLGSFQFSDDDDNCGFSQWVDPQPLTPIRITSTTYTTSSSTTRSCAWTKHLLPQIIPPTTSAALVRLALVNATRRWEIGLLFLHLHHHHRVTTCHLSSPQVSAPCSLDSSRTTTFRM
jgi:hypothetical protein